MRMLQHTYLSEGEAMRQMTLKAKISLGFAGLIALAAVLGGVSVWQMKKAGQNALHLAEGYIPEVELANDLERNALEGMMDFRSYILTGERSLFESGQAHLREIGKIIPEAERLVGEFPELVKLGEGMKTVSSSMASYESIMGQYQVLDRRIGEARQELDVEASRYMENAADYLSGQNDQMRQEFSSGVGVNALDERLVKITLINDIIDLGNAVRVTNFMAQALRSPEQLRQGLNIFTQVDDKFREIRAITRLQADQDRLDEIEAAAANYKQAMEKLLSSWDSQDALTAEREEAA